MKKNTQPEPQIDKKIAELQSTTDDLRSSLARALADYANLERRFSEQSTSVIKFATSSLLTKLLDIRDPSSMECQEMTEGEKDKVIKVIRPGYKLHDRVLRTARVVVGSGTTK